MCRPSVGWLVGAHSSVVDWLMTFAQLAGGSVGPLVCCVRVCDTQPFTINVSPLDEHGAAIAAVTKEAAAAEVRVNCACA